MDSLEYRDAARSALDAKGVPCEVEAAEDETLHILLGRDDAAENVAAVHEALDGLRLKTAYRVLVVGDLQRRAA